MLFRSHFSKTRGMDCLQENASALLIIKHATVATLQSRTPGHDPGPRRLWAGRRRVLKLGEAAHRSSSATECDDYVSLAVALAPSGLPCPHTQGSPVGRKLLHLDVVADPSLFLADVITAASARPFEGSLSRTLDYEGKVLSMRGTMAFGSRTLCPCVPVRATWWVRGSTSLVAGTRL